ncbi:MAG TPA: DUF1211 domain-containing protein [Candidatus Dorea intestinavium]|nr:DUF1211 domain-containing protein [Candidatus Dorea intestinavium]
MSKTRMEAFTDAIIAIIMTLLVLSLVPPASPTFGALWEMRGKFLVYLISFISLAIYWNNHHHLLQAVEKVNGKVLWSNTLFILCLSMFPFATAWVDVNINSFAPEFIYGALVMATNLSYSLLSIVLRKAEGKEAKITKAIGKNYKQKVTIVLNVASLLLAKVFPPIVLILFAISMLLWIIPDKRIESLYQ